MYFSLTWSPYAVLTNSLFYFRSHYNKIGAYSQSKSAQIMFTKILDEQLSSENKPVKVYAVHPGFIRSNLYTQTWYTKFVSLTMGFMFKVRKILDAYLIFLRHIQLK